MYVQEFFVNINLMFFVPFVEFAVFTDCVIKIKLTSKVFITAFNLGKCLPHKNGD